MKNLTITLVSIVLLLCSFSSSTVRPQDGQYRAGQTITNSGQICAYVKVHGDVAIADLFLFSFSGLDVLESMTDTLRLDTVRQIYRGRVLAFEDWFGKLRMTTKFDTKVFGLYSFDSRVRREKDYASNLTYCRNGLQLNALREEYMSGKDNQAVARKEFYNKLDQLNIAKSQREMTEEQFKIELEKLQSALIIPKN